MALHLNLYREIHRQAARERRNPVKLAALAGLVFLLFLVLWYVYRLNTVSSLERKRADMQHTWVTLEPKMKEAVESEPALLAQQKSNQMLVEWVHQRFYWGPFLEKLVEVTPSNVQIVTLMGTVDPNKEKKTVDVLVKGVAAGVQPRTSAEEYRRSLQEGFAQVYGEVTAAFDANSLEDSPDTVQLDGQTLNTATFRIRLQLHPVATPKPGSEQGKSK